MANPFAVEPPSWYQRIAQPSNALNALGSLAGRYIGAAGSAATGTGDPEVDKKPYYQRFRTNLANTYKQDADPMWRMREMRMQTEMAQFAMNVESYRFKNQLIQKQSLQEAQAQREIWELQDEAQRNGEGPNGVLNTIYRGNNPKVLTFWNTTQLAASRQLTAMRVNSDKVNVNRMIDTLLPVDRAQALSMPREEGTGLPTPETWAFVYQAAARSQAAKEAEQRAKTGGDLIFEDFDIGGKKYTGVRQEGKGGFRLLPHEAQGANKMNFAKWQEAARLYRDATAALSDVKKTLKAEQMAEARASQAAAKKTMEDLEKAMISPASAGDATEDPLGLFK